jgi:hypothetical protein
MSWFRRKPNAADALDRALGRIFEAQASQIEAVSGLLTKMSELSTKRAASVMGTRSANVKKARKIAAGMVKKDSDCPLCIDPTRRDVTVEMIQAHRAHAPIAPVEAEGNGEAKENA